MKIVFRIKYLLCLLVVFIGIIGFSSCKKQNVGEPSPGTSSNTPTGTFMMHLHTYIESSEVDLYNITYTTSAGRNISLSMAQLYISNFQLVKLDGSTYDIPGKKILKVLETDTYIVGDVPVGNYKSIRFKVGLDSTTNEMVPTLSPDSLLLNKPAMWFNSVAQPDGYVFMNFQGMIDTSAGMTGTMASFVYKIGTNTHYKQVSMPDRNFTIVKDQAEYGHIYIDYNMLFTGIQLNQSSNLSVVTAADNNTVVAATIVNNIPAMFIYE